MGCALRYISMFECWQQLNGNKLREANAAAGIAREAGCGHNEERRVVMQISASAAEMNRREFVTVTAAAGAVLAMPEALAQRREGEMIYRTLGGTGEKIS